jgi:uncharacterized protein
MTGRKKMIPEFPQFKRLELSDRPEIESITGRQPPYADYNFTSLWCWDIYERVLLSQCDGHLIVRFTDDVTGEPFYSFFGPSSVLSANVAQKLLHGIEQDGLKPMLRLVPENMIGVLDHERFHIEEDRDNHDYIVSLEKLSAFRGNAFGRHKALTNFFKRQNQHIRLVTLDVRDRYTCRMIETLSATWERSKGYSVDCDHRAFKRFFEIADWQGIECHGLYIKNDLVGFHSAETINNGYAIGHFIKADTRVKGVYSYLQQATAKNMYAKGLRFLNIEQDLGISGLRTAKTALRPVCFLKKYTISRAKSR